MIRRIVSVAAVVAIAALFGCSAPEERPLAKDHPANVEAPEATLPPASKTLDVASADPFPTAPAEPHSASATAAPAPAGGHEGPGAHGAAAKPVYRCPMDPEVVSDKPERCPRCGMFTILKVREELASYDDPGWYKSPPGTQADVAAAEDLKRDGIDPAAGKKE